MKKAISLFISGILLTTSFTLADINAGADTELWDKFLKYDLCITDYDSLTEEEQELCHFIFDTEYGTDATIVCERARRILAHDEDIGERITLDQLKESCGVWDKNADYRYGTLEYIHCVPDIVYLDEDAADYPYSSEYWLDDNGTVKVIGKMDIENREYTVIDKDEESPYQINVKAPQFISRVRKDGVQSRSYNFENAIEVNDDYYYITSQGTAVLFKNKYDDDYWKSPDAITEPHIIPSEIDGHKVTAIDTDAFEYSPYTEIVLPDSIEYIGTRAFTGSKYLEKVNFPKGMKTISDMAFGDTSLKELNIDCPELDIKYMAFMGIDCEEIYVNAKEIGNSAFMLSSDLKKAVLGDKVEKIGYYAFTECSKLEEINIPYSVRTIGQGAFLSCTSLKTITVPDSVKVIGTFPGKTGSVMSDLPIEPVIPLYKEPECAFYSDCKIKGRAGSEIESYAKEWGLGFTAIDSLDDENNDTEIKGNSIYFNKKPEIVWTFTNDMYSDSYEGDNYIFTPQKNGNYFVVVGSMADEGVRTGYNVKNENGKVSIEKTGEYQYKRDDEHPEQVISDELNRTYTLIKQFISEHPDLRLRIVDIKELSGDNNDIDDMFKNKVIIEYFWGHEEKIFALLNTFMRENNIDENLVFFIQQQDTLVDNSPKDLETAYEMLKKFTADFSNIRVVDKEELSGDDANNLPDSYKDKVVLELNESDKDDVIPMIQTFMQAHGIDESLVAYSIIDAALSDEKGDANCDGTIDMADAVLIMQYIANPDKYGENGTDENHITEQGKKNADIAGENDGITNADALAVQKKLLKLD